MIQTWQPNHPVIQALLSGDSDRFYAVEGQARHAAGLPPYGRLAALIVSSEDRHAADAHARGVARAAQTVTADLGDKDRGIRVLGPAEAPIAMLRGRHRFRLLVMAPRRADIQAFLRATLAASPKLRGSLRIDIDVDPQSFL